MSNEGFTSIEQLAGELGISARTSYRWLKTGKIKRKREGGRTLFFPADTVKLAVKSVSPGDIPGITVNRFGKERGHTNSVSVGGIKPSPQLIEKIEAADMIEEEVRGKKAEIELKGLMPLIGDDPSVREERASLQKLHISIDKIKAQKELKALTREETESQRRADFKARIEKVKESIIPEILKKQIPPDILLTTYDALSRGLAELPYSTSDDDFILYANLILSHVWNWKEIYPSIRAAKIRVVFDGIHSMLEAERQSYSAQHGNIFSTFESFVNFWLSQLSVKQSIAIVHGISELSRIVGIKI